MDDNNKTNQNNAITKGIIIFVILAIIAAALFIIPDYLNKNKVRDGSFSQVNKICELATLKCYYHDVAEYIDEPDGLFQYGLFKYGYKKFWIEYDGIVEFGIDAGKVIINEPDSNGIVKIYVPKARVLNVYMDEDSMSDIVSETGVLTAITAEDQANAYSYTQSQMKEKAGKDESMVEQARDNAKILLERYVVEVGSRIGKQYKVSWIDNPANLETTDLPDDSEG